MREIPVVVQLYTLREYCERDFIGTLRKVAELGYHGVELAGLYGHSPQEIRNVLEEFGLKAASSHVPLVEMKRNLSKVIEDHQILGCEYIVCPYILEADRTEEGYQSLISFLKSTGPVVTEAGLSLAYHNHDFELRTLATSGKSVLETIYSAIGAESLQAELDIYWLQRAGENPVEWIEKYRGRTPIVHLKDMTTDEERAFAELGTGGVDIEAVLNKGEEAGVKWWVVEQDVCRLDPFESIGISLNYLKTKLPYLNK
ncbi:sugar phosphate isomerase/epimerase [Bacillus sp. OK048]|uniref:sugar phosphate isomerase/epimerase family protein n=1 Tax=Bacillus sp. OK048 TaxID=1882761 RepID=UPI00088FABAB|nr:sugar phosphate isomerase/epimerase [Bacillus sp. OK048]SDM90064.1 Sugar phosphate isomerase/epimerase [Bacillus sp. OK048]